MPFTPLHRALGMDSSELTFSMVQDAVDQEVRERGDLDWKKVLPHQQAPRANEEFAKDVAAMVNGGGGMIVYGVDEVSATSAAKEVVTVGQFLDSTERKLRGWAYSLIQPSVRDIEFRHLVDPADPDRSVVTLMVHASFETPHFVMAEDTLRAPRRYGAQTVYMSERDIEQAYRKRFEDRRNNDRNLEDLIGQAMAGVDHGGGVWLVAAARPTIPRLTSAGRLSRGVARQIMEKSNRNPFLQDAGGSLLQWGFDQHPGFRKWRFIERRNERTVMILEVHDDGSVGLAYLPMGSRDEEFDPSSDVHIRDAQALPAHIVNIARIAAEYMDLAGEYQVNMIFSPPTQDAIFIRTFENSGRYILERDPTKAIPNFIPVTGIFAANGPDVDALVSVRQFATDVLNQGGIEKLPSGYVYETI